MGIFRGTAWYYARYRPAYPPGLIAELVRAAGLTGASRVLDLGCGTGQVAVPLAAHVGEVVAVDAERAMLDELPPGVTAVHARAEEVDGSYDLVTIGRALHWFGGPSFLERLVPMTPQVALLGDRIRDSEALSVVLETAQEFAGARPEPPGARIPYSEALAASGFPDVVELSVVEERRWTQDSLVGWAYSTSFASVERLGDRRAEFERVLRSRLADEYVERVPVDALLGRRGDSF
jgi:SAM-dependent methyltransferase